jgi:hypothetical protein
VNPLTRYLLGEDGTLQSLEDRATHHYVIGQPGTGKSRALESWPMQDIADGRGLTFIDPHGDSYAHLVKYVAQMPAVHDRLVLIDPCDPKWVVCFNPLEAVDGVLQERLAGFLTDVVIKIWKIDPTSAPRMVRLLANTFLALTNLGLTLPDLHRLLLKSDFRERLLPRLTHEGAGTYFLDEFPQTQTGIQ